MAEIKEIIQNSKEPEVTKAVFDEIQAIGSDVKKNYSELQSNFDLLKKEVSEKDYDGIVKEKVEKLAEDITTRQEALDGGITELKDNVTKRLDEIEVASKRPSPHGSSEQTQKAEKELKDFCDSLNALKSPDHGSKFKMRKQDTAIGMDEYLEYAKNFEGFVRLGKDKLYSEVENVDFARKSMLVGSDPDGGYTVPTAMSNMIIERLFEIDPIRSLASVENISTGAIEWLVDFDEADAEWEGGETVITDETGTPQLNKKRIDAYTLAARVRVTQTLLEDSAVNIESWLSRHIGQKFGRMEGEAFVSGDGVGKPRGFLTWPDGADGTYGVVEQIPMLHATTLTVDGFIQVKYAMIEQYLNRGTWLMNRTTMREATKMKTGDGDFIWKPGLASDPTSTILGLPVRMSTSMPAIAANALSVVLADWKEAYMIVDRLGITTQRDPYTQKPFIEFYTRKRVGASVVNYQAIKIGKIAAS